jgi:SAM-dependent methyltransferase
MASTVLSPKSCPICGASAGFGEFCPASFNSGDERNMIECRNCGASLLWPLPEEKDFFVFYGKEYFNFDRDSEIGKGYYYAEILKKIKTKGRYLEIGSALGWFLYGIRNNCDWEIFALETGRTAADFSRKILGLNVKESQLLDAKYPDNYFDFIRFNNVLEHVPNPGEAFAEAARILAPGGTLYIAVPNGKIDRLDYRTYYKETGKPAASRDGHVFFFSKKSLYEIARINNLKITQEYSGGIKRALRALGFWPRKKGWEAVHEPKTRHDTDAGQKLPESMGKFEKPDGYYKYSLYRDIYSRLPGLLPLASDYIAYFKKSDFG